MDDNLDINTSNSAENLKTPEDCLKYGLELNAAGQVAKALEVFSRGLALEPFHVELRQQRGRKNMASRRWQAISDFTLAAHIDPDYWEIWYYMGVTYYLIRDYEKSRNCFKTCIGKSNDGLVPSVDWLWTLGKKLGAEDSGVLNLISDFEADPDDEDYAYARRIMLYKGLLTPENFYDWKTLEKRGNTDIDFVTQSYGLSNWHTFRGEIDKSNEILKQIAERNGVANAFAYMLAIRDIKDRSERKTP